ncbi:hypothetical protein JY651_31430 [Pyxidicoccus parkwayensis]|uniref:Uncharacterized protein n=1 Tax=Pyxidicoccus parkwayensis TaxID=2813578 RepID=A0ABX7NLQ2_9BACT|nr:hypothetical protein [Pyxidicoccus parkwaysis]QSQ19784.1 hypothetical protein JY651_31430 [Pyxidicoccus parkwaysis]
MSTAPDHHTSFISIVGTNPRDLQLLANLSPPVDDPESIVTVIVSLVHEANTTWTKLLEVDAWVTDLARSSSGRLYAVDMDGQLHFTDSKGAWTNRDVGCPDGLVSLWVASDDQVFAAGDHGERVRVSGKQVDIVRDEQERRLNAVHGCSTDDVYMVGEKGAVFRYQGQTWSELESPTNYSLLSVLCRSPREVYLAGARGMLFRGDGDTWEQLKAPEVTITSLAWYRDALYAAAGKDGIFRLGPQGLEKLKDLTLYRLRVIGDHLFGLGGRLVARFDGKGWWGGPVNSL